MAQATAPILDSTKASLAALHRCGRYQGANRTSRFPASGFPTGFTARHTESKLTARGFGTVSNSPSPLGTAISGGACH